MSATLRSVSLLRSFGFALEGVSYLIRTQRSAQIEIVIGVVVTLVGAWLGIGAIEWGSWSSRWRSSSRSKRSTPRSSWR